MDKIIVIVGPTGSGKTKLAIDIAKAINGEIINADAFQVYKEISIGTAKATQEEIKQVKFYLNSEKSIYEPWDIKIFQDECKDIINKIISKKKIPIVVGGSNLYIDALINNYDLSADPRDDKYDNLTNEEIYKQLFSLNPEIAKKIDLNNRKRLIRALQINSSNQSYHKKNPKLYDCFIIYSKPTSKEEMYDKINNNVDKMIKNGWKEEIENLYKKDKNVGNLNAFKAIGYQEILNSIINGSDINVDLIKQRTRQYAKRQITWINHHYQDLHVFNDNLISILKDINLFIKKK